MRNTAAPPLAVSGVPIQRIHTAQIVSFIHVSVVKNQPIALVVLGLLCVRLTHHLIDRLHSTGVDQRVLAQVCPGGRIAESLRHNIAIRPTPRQKNWGFGAQLRYRTTRADERNGNAIPNTGGEWVDVIPSVQYRINEKSGLNISVRIPVYRNLDGALQFTTSSAANLGFSYAF